MKTDTVMLELTIMGIAAITLIGFGHAIFGLSFVPLIMLRIVLATYEK